MDWDFVLTTLAFIIAFVSVIFIFYICKEYFMKLIFTIVKINKLAEEQRIAEENRKTRESH